MMGIEHERIHLETSSVLIRQLPLDRCGRPPLAGLRRSGPGARQRAAGRSGRHEWSWARTATTRCTAGTTSTASSRPTVAAFRPAKYLVSNGEFRDFMDDGGYTAEELVDRRGLGLAPVPQGRASAVLGAGRRDWKLRCLAEEIPLPWNWPVEVNQLEAKAFCNWKAAATGQPIRLPTEDEWYRLLRSVRHPRPARLGPARRQHQPGAAGLPPARSTAHLTAGSAM